MILDQSTFGSTMFFNINSLTVIPIWAKDFFFSVSSSAVAVTAPLIGWRAFGSAPLMLTVARFLIVAVKAQS